MGFGKSFGISFLIYIVLNFLMNMLLVVAANVVPLMDWFSSIASPDTYRFLSSLFAVQSLEPSGTSILGGLGGGISEFTTGGNIFLGIMMIGAPILPGLIGAIVAGKMAESSKQAFGGWMLTPLISAVVLVVFAFLDPSLNTNVLIINMVLAGGFPGPWEVIVYTLLIGVILGLFWSGLAAISGAED